MSIEVKQVSFIWALALVAFMVALIVWTQGVGTPVSKEEDSAQANWLTPYVTLEDIQFTEQYDAGGIKLGGYMPVTQYNGNQLQPAIGEY